jgi:hypothetical protein
VELVPPIDLFDQKHQRCRKIEKLIGALTSNFYDSLPDDCFNQTISFLSIMSKAKNMAVQETAGYVALMMLSRLAPRLKEVAQNVSSRPNGQELLALLNRSFVVLFDVLKQLILQR